MRTLSSSLFLAVVMALGASPVAVQSHVVRQGMKPVWTGLAAGATSALVAGRTFEGMLFGVPPHDPVTLIAVSVILAAAGFMACYLPAHRAARIDPLAMLRYE